RGGGDFKGDGTRPGGGGLWRVPSLREFYRFRPYLKQANATSLPPPAALKVPAAALKVLAAALKVLAKGTPRLNFEEKARTRRPALRSHLSSRLLSIILKDEKRCRDTESEHIQRIARRCGFAEAYEHVLTR
ncbi:hypothetical protein ANANG_G00066980, partial [Anguilla anguilla]